jgi:hypothetical protein
MSAARNIQDVEQTPELFRLVVMLTGVQIEEGGDGVEHQTLV